LYGSSDELELLVVIEDRHSRDLPLKFELSLVTKEDVLENVLPRVLECSCGSLFLINSATLTEIKRRHPSWASIMDLYDSGWALDNHEVVISECQCGLRHSQQEASLALHGSPWTLNV